MTKVWLFLMLAPALHAAVDGTVVNGTTGKPQPGAVVTLFSMSGGSMAVKGTATSDRFGKFRIDQSIQGQELLQALHQGVTYNVMLRQGMPASDVAIEVYDLAGDTRLAKVLRHAVLLQPAGIDLSVRENILLRNDGKVTLRRPNEGTFHFYVPDSAVESLRVRSRPQNGVSLQQTPARTSEPGVYKLDLPLKPGDTQVDLSYTLPFRNPTEFKGRRLQSDGAVRLVVPSGVTLQGDGLRFLGEEPKSRASNYAVDTPEYRVRIQAAAGPAAGNAAREEASPPPGQILPRIYDNVYWILGFAFAALTLGFARLYRMTVAPVAQALALPAAVSGRRSERGGGRKGGKREAENAVRSLRSGSLASHGQRGRHSVGAA
jgi:hypothetical protein